MPSSIKSKADYEKQVLISAGDFNRGDYAKALEGFLELEKSNFKNAAVHEVLCTIYLKLENLPEAEKQLALFESMIPAERKNTAPKKSFTTLVKEAGTVESNEKKYQDLKQQNNAGPEAVDTALRLSVLYMAQGEYDKAENLMKDFMERYKKARSG